MSGQNPLLNPIVLDNIAKQGALSVSDLKCFRLVSKDWFRSSLAMWRRTAVLKITTDRNGRAFPPRDSKALKLNDFRDLDNDTLFKHLDRFPFKHFQFTRCDISLDGLWDKIGPAAEYVHFDNCFFCGEGQGRFADMLVAKIVFEKCPNLKTLKMTSNYQFPGIMVKMYDMTKEQVNLQQEGFQPHKQLEEVAFNSGVPEKLVMILPLAEKLKSVIIATSGERRYEEKASEEEANSSGKSKVGERMVEKLFEDKERILQERLINQMLPAMVGIPDDDISRLMGYPHPNYMNEDFGFLPFF